MISFILHLSIIIFQQSQINNDNSLFVAGVSGELNGSWPVNQEIEVTDHECPTVGSLSVTGENFDLKK